MPLNGTGDVKPSLSSAAELMPSTPSTWLSADAATLDNSGVHKWMSRACFREFIYSGNSRPIPKMDCSQLVQAFRSGRHHLAQTCGQKPANLDAQLLDEGWSTVTLNALFP